MSSRRNKRIFSAIGLGADTDLVTAESMSVGRDGYIALQALVDNGAGAAPTDSPVGVLEIHASAGARYTQVTGTTITTELAKVAPSGNTKVDAWAILVGVPGSAIKLRYKRTSGGGGNSRLTLDVSTW